MDGAVHTYKACLVLKGFTQTPRIDYEETLSTCVDIRGIRILISIAAFYDYEIWQMDIKISFLNLYLNEEYLRNNKGYVFSKYEGDTKRELRVSYYTDAGYLTDADDLNVFILNGGFVDWKSINQSIFATSSTDAKYMATFDASKEAVWIRKFITRLGVVPTI
ncbi:retrotransposon protein, putative, ty1-copia subclass [Tanacetum coccineum]